LTAAYEKRTIKFQMASMQGSSNPSMADKPLCALLINLF
jgi:hypothetical protein